METQLDTIDSFFKCDERLDVPVMIPEAAASVSPPSVRVESNLMACQLSETDLAIFECGASEFLYFIDI